MLTRSGKKGQYRGEDDEVVVVERLWGEGGYVGQGFIIFASDF